MTLLVSIAVYAGALMFVFGSLYRAVRYARMPVHLRWELYPVPESKAEQARAMAAEILLLKKLWENNRALWWRSYAFHLGLYLLIGTAAMVTAAALGGPPWLRPLYATTGLAGALLVLGGAIALFARRLTDPDLRTYTRPADLFHLAFFAITAAVGLAAYFSAGGALAAARAVLTFDTAASLPPLTAAALLLAAALAAYIPLTHMAHFVAKYFTYHTVLWDDHAPGERMRRKLAAQLAMRPAWGAKHVGGGTWVDIAAGGPPK